MSETGNSIPKPPLGISPEWVWVEKRVRELIRAISEYVGFGNLRPIQGWLDELSRHIVALGIMRGGSDE